MTWGLQTPQSPFHISLLWCHTTVFLCSLPFEAGTPPLPLATSLPISQGTSKGGVVG